MKRWLLLAALVVAISATATVAVQYLPSDSEPVDMPVAPKVQGPSPKVVVVGDSIFKFDIKSQHSKFEHDWVIKNEGDADLVMQKARSTCSCTVAEFDKKGQEGNSQELRLKPGRSTTIHMTFETREFSGDHDWSSTATTNDPRTPEVTFGAHGKVQPALMLFPPERTIEFSALSNETDHSGNFALWSPDRPALKIIKVTTSKPDMILTATEPLTDNDRKDLKITTGGGFRITITIKAGMPLGQFRDEVVVETDHPLEPELRLTVVGKITGPIILIPDYLSIRDVSSSDGGHGDVTLMVRGLRETRFTVAHEPEQLKVDITPSPPDSKGGKYRLTVTIPPGTSSGDIEDVILLKSDHPQAATVKVPVSIFIRDKR